MKEDLIKIIADLYSVADNLEDANDDVKCNLQEAIDGLERLVLDWDDGVDTSSDFESTTFSKN